MNKDSIKFPAVITVEPILGIDEGTVLRFDWGSGKYVTVEEDEEIGDNDYYYSGFAIAIDPYIVRDYVKQGVVFCDIEQPVEEPDTNEKEEVKEIVQEVAPEKQAPPVEVKEEGIAKPTPEKELHTLVVDCACGSRRILDHIDAPGLSAYLMANDPESFIELHCPECGSHLKLWFAPDDEQVR